MVEKNLLARLQNFMVLQNGELYVKIVTILPYYLHVQMVLPYHLPYHLKQQLRQDCPFPHLRGRVTIIQYLHV
jgi:hypothetical protein